MTASELSKTGLSVHALGKLPLQDYDRTHKLQPATTWWGKKVDAFTDWIEDVFARFSLHGDRPVFSNAQFPWVDDVEGDWQKVRVELDQVMQYRDSMPSFQDIIKEVSLIQTDHDWKTYFLKGVGMDCGENASRCPDTMKMLEKIPGATTAFFSILSPHKHIPSHRGPWVGVLRLHVGLMVPQPREQCRIRIANQSYSWTEGKCLIFDDTFNHEVWNDTEGYRVVLFIDFERPLKWPWSWFNHILMNLAPLAPFLREAKGKQKAWEIKMWGKKN